MPCGLNQFITDNHLQNRINILLVFLVSIVTSLAGFISIGRGKALSLSELQTMADDLPEQQSRGAYPIPLNEDARIHSLHDVGILDTPPDERFDRIARLAAGHFDTPMARITFVDRDRTWYKACVGPSATEGPRDTAICSHTVMRDGVLVSRDMSVDPQFRSFPQVVAEPKLRFYAGAPITLDNGMRVGSLCVFDTKPHMDFSDRDSAYLIDLAEIVVHELSLHQQLANRDENLKQAERTIDIARGARKRFLDIVSHELKTPLSHVSGFSKIIAEQQIGPIGNQTYVEYAGFLHESAERLEGLVKRVLRYSSAESGELRLAETTVATKTLLDQFVNLAHMRNATSKINIEHRIDADVPEALYIDEIHMVEAVVEILDNAIAFSPAGAIVDLRMESRDDGGTSIRVLDRGPGFAPEKNTDFIIAYTQGDEGLSRRHSGIGLGIPVADAIVQLHGGSLSLSDRPNGGTAAEFLLPVYRNRSR